MKETKYIDNLNRIINNLVNGLIAIFIQCICIWLAKLWLAKLVGVNEPILLILIILLSISITYVFIHFIILCVTYKKHKKNKQEEK